ncbi:hypothetical protein CU098_006468 [Rhizopus stolonifer]|uniref:Uncharacterized protein n=1 Tax=Rhizopus stolonifer TaxID=4846 RepID=A0A367IPA6_RHIST|nr:hypothetical protein CU098_006468 [Rhizopus stolonifer]
MEEIKYNSKELTDIVIKQENKFEDNKNKDYESDIYDDMDYYIDDEMIDYMNSFDTDDFYSDCDYDNYDYCGRYDEADEI